MRNIVRVVKGQQAHYSIIANQPAVNPHLSYKARGILWLCLTRPDNWIFNAQYLINMSESDGRDAVRSGLRELEEARYMFRRSVRDPKTGQWAGSVWLVFEFPWPMLGYTEEQLTGMALAAFAADDASAPETGFPAPGEPAAGYPRAENPPLLKTEHVVKTDTTKNGEKKSANAPPPSQPELFPSDPEQTTDFSNKWDRKLQDALRAEAKAKGRRGPRAFQSMAQKEKWRDAAATITKLKDEAELDKALAYALEQGRTSRQAVINTVAVWADNLTKPYHGNGGKGNGNGKGKGTTQIMNAEEYDEWAAENAPEQELPEYVSENEIPF